MKKYEIDPELKYLKPLRFIKYSPIQRWIQNVVFELTNFFTRPKKGIQSKVFWIRGYHYKKIKIIFYDFKEKQENLPIILYFHGGAFQVEGTPVHIHMLNDLMIGANHKAVYVKYRLAPKHPFPTALFDCYHALQWVSTHHEHLGVDLRRITVAGDSAGGNLAAAVALYSRDHNGPKIEKQLLIYPVIDLGQHTNSAINYVDTPMWNSNLNRIMWDLYLKNGDFGMLNYASPSYAKLNGSPKTYIETAEFDPLRDEGVIYAKRLKEAGVDVTEHHTFKTVHGYDAMFFSDFMKGMKENRINFLKGDGHEKN